MKLVSRKGMTALMAAASMMGLGAAAQADNVITLGASVQMTGARANTGRYYKDAYQLAVDKINAAGGVTVGGKTYKLKLDMLDNQSDVNLSVRQYVQLVSADKVNFLLGPFASNFVISDSSVSEKYQIPMVEGGGSSGQIFSRGYKYVFGTLPPAGGYYASTIKMMGQLKPTAKTVAIVSADDSFDVSVAKGTRKLVKDAGLTIAVDEQYGENSSDFSSILTKIKAAHVDAILWSGHEPEALNFIRQMKQLDVNPADMYAFTVGVPTADFRQALGQDANYALGMTTWLPSPALKDKWFGDAAAFAKEFEAKYGYAPDYHAASGAADVETYVYAIEKAGSLDPKKVRDAIAASDFNSLYANVKYAANGQINLPQIVVQVQDGDLKPIYTTHFINQPQYPVPAWNKR